MSKILDAVCDGAGNISVGNVLVPNAKILSEGKQESEGVVLLDAFRKTYLTSNASDIKTAIEKLVTTINNISDALTTVSTALTAIGAGMTGPTTAPPATLPTDVATIITKVTAIGVAKAELEQLKEALK